MPSLNQNSLLKSPSLTLTIRYSTLLESTLNEPITFTRLVHSQIVVQV